MYDAWQIIEEMSDWLSEGPGQAGFKEYCADRMRPFLEGEDAFAWGDFEELPSDDKANLIALQWQGYVVEHLTDPVLQKFLKSRRPAYSSENVAYIHALRLSRPSIFQVLEFHSDQSVVLRDLLHGGPNIVADGSSPSYLWRRWGVFEGRLVECDGERSISPGISLVMFDAHFSKLIEGELRIAKGLAMNAERRREYMAEVEASLSRIAFTQWLGQALFNAWRAAEDRTRRASQSASWTYLCAPIVGSPEEVARRLDAAHEFEDSEGSWAWVEVRKQKEIVAAEILLQHANLYACCDSGGIAKKVEARLEVLLKGVIGKVRKLKPSQVLEFLAGDDAADAPPVAPATKFQLAEARQAALDELLKVCRGYVKAVGGNPHQLVKTKKGRELVVKWLRMTETSFDMMTPEGAEPFDLMPVWHELGIADLRLGDEVPKPRRKAPVVIDVGQQTLDLG